MTLIFNIRAFCATRLELPRGQEKVSLEFSNNMLTCVQWLFGQTVVKSQDGQFILIPSTPLQHPWINLALKISVVIAFIFFHRIVLLFFLIPTALGTASRLYSLGYPDVREGLFGKKISPPIQPTPLLPPEENIARGVSILTPFIKTIPVIGNLKDYDRSIQELGSFFTEFLKTPDEIDLDALLDEVDCSLLSGTLEEDNIEEPDSPQDAKQWLADKVKDKATYFYPFALARQLCYKHNLEYIHAPTKNNKTNLILYKSALEKMQRLKIDSYPHELHEDMNLALVRECKILTTALQNLKANEKILEETLLKSYYLIQSKNPEFELFRQSRHPSFTQLCQEIDKLKCLPSEKLSQIIAQMDKEWVAPIEINETEESFESDSQQLAEVSDMLKEFLAFFSQILGENDPKKLEALLQQAYNNVGKEAFPLFATEVLLHMRDVDPHLKPLFKKLDPNFVAILFDTHQKCVKKLKKLKLDRFLPNSTVMQGLKKIQSFLSSGKN